MKEGTESTMSRLVALAANKWFSGFGTVGRGFGLKALKTNPHDAWGRR
jgi:hypothetical protein